jgi:hypothetical protein
MRLPQRGLAAAEKARDDGDGNLAHLSLHREVHPWELQVHAGVFARFVRIGHANGAAPRRQ